MDHCGGHRVLHGIEHREFARISSSDHPGALLFFGGGFAVYGFLYGRTKIYEEGILLSNGICPWHCIDAWTVTSVSDTPHLQITIGKWRPLMGVRPDQVADLEEFLSHKSQEKAQPGDGTSAIIAQLGGLGDCRPRP